MIKLPSFPCLCTWQSSNATEMFKLPDMLTEKPMFEKCQNVNWVNWTEAQLNDEGLSLNNRFSSEHGVINLVNEKLHINLCMLL